MNYVKQILFPGEKVLYDGHVHPRVLARGVLLLALAAFDTHLIGDTGSWNSPMLSLMREWSATSGFWKWMFEVCRGWQIHSPHIAFELKVLSLGFLIWGLIHFIKGVLLMRSTELVVTDMRIIVKSGIFNIVTLEMDRRRVAQVLIDQTLLGRMFNYGHIYIRGFTGVIGGLPVMVNPHLIERFVNFRY